MRTLHLTALLGALSILTACGGALPPPAKPPSRGLPPGSLQPPGTFYSEGLSTLAAGEGLAFNVGEKDVRRGLRRSVPAPPALNCLAREYAARFAFDKRDPDPVTVQALADHCGFWARPREVFTVAAHDLQALDRQLRKVNLVDLPGTVGVGVAKSHAGGFTVTMMRDPGDLRLMPIERTGGILKGRLMKGGGTLEIWIDDGQPKQLEFQFAKTGDFMATIPPQARIVELVRRTGDFRETLGLLRMGPRLDGYSPPPEQAGPKDSGALLTAINAARAKGDKHRLRYSARLQPLLDDWLGRVAKGGKRSTPPGIVDERGWRYARTRYAFSEGRDAEQAVQLLQQTPTGQRILMSEDDEVSFGLRPYPNGPGFDLLILSLKSFEQAAPEAARAKLFKALNTARKTRNLPPLAAAPQLDAVAQQVAELALTGAVRWKDSVQTLMAKVRTDKLVRGAFGAGGYTDVDLGGAKFGEQPEVYGKDYQVVGVGVASGPLPGGGAPRHIVLFIVAERLPNTGS